MYSCDVDGSQEGRYSQFITILEDLNSSIINCHLESTLITLRFIQLVEEVGVSKSILNVFGEVLDCLPVARVAQVEVEPPQEQFLWVELQQVLELLFLVLKSDEEWVGLQVYVLLRLDLDYLPQQTQDDVFSLFGDEGGLDTHDNYSN